MDGLWIARLSWLKDALFLILRDRGLLLTNLPILQHLLRQRLPDFDKTPILRQTWALHQHAGFKFGPVVALILAALTLNERPQGASSNDFSRLGPPETTEVVTTSALSGCPPTICSA